MAVSGWHAGKGLAWWQEQKPERSPSDHTYEEERTQWKWYEAFNLHSLPQRLVTSREAVSPRPSQTVPPVGTKCQSLQGAFLLQTTTGTIIFALRPICCLSELAPRPPYQILWCCFSSPKLSFYLMSSGCAMLSKAM